MSINDRIKILIDILANGKQNAFSKAANIKASTINGIVGPRQSEPSFYTLKKITDAYPAINFNWLMKDVGMPFVESDTQIETSRETELNMQYRSSLGEISNSVFLSGNLKLLRKNVQISQDALGKKFGIKRDNIASYERGTKPKLPILIDIVNFFHISLEELISYDLRKHPEILEKVSNLEKKTRKNLDS